MLTLVRLLVAGAPGVLLPPAPHDTLEALVTALERVDPMRQRYYATLRRE